VVVAPDIADFGLQISDFVATIRWFNLKSNLTSEV